jgi:hypothetical protein
LPLRSYAEYTSTLIAFGLFFLSANHRLTDVRRQMQGSLDEADGGCSQS